LLVLFTIGMTTGAYSQVNSNRDPLQTFKRVTVEFQDGTVVKGVNATLYADSLNFSKNKSYQRNPLSQIKYFSYSNDHHGRFGAILGLIGGIGVTAVIFNRLDKKYTLENVDEEVKDKLPIGIATVFLGTIMGNAIGSIFYTNWNDYDSSKFNTDKQSMTFKIQNKKFMVGYKIPLR